MDSGCHRNDGREGLVLTGVGLGDRFWVLVETWQGGVGMSLDLSRVTIVEAGREMAAGRLSSVELVEATLRRIERLNPTLKAFLTVCGDYAMSRAREVEAEMAAGQYRGPLHGIPYSLKDVIATKDVRTTFGHPRLHDFQTDEDATVRRLLDYAGAILVGKVYSQIGRGDSLVDCCNPWDVT